LGGGGGGGGGGGPKKKKFFGHEPLGDRRSALSDALGADRKAAADRHEQQTTSPIAAACSSRRPLWPKRPGGRRAPVEREHEIVSARAACRRRRRAREAIAVTSRAAEKSSVRPSSAALPARRRCLTALWSGMLWRPRAEDLAQRWDCRVVPMNPPVAPSAKCRRRIDRAVFAIRHPRRNADCPNHSTRITAAPLGCWTCLHRRVAVVVSATTRQAPPPRRSDRRRWRRRRLVRAAAEGAEIKWEERAAVSTAWLAAEGRLSAWRRSGVDRVVTRNAAHGSDTGGTLAAACRAEAETVGVKPERSVCGRLAASPKIIQREEDPIRQNCAEF